jgi:hypothetical protein
MSANYLTRYLVGVNGGENSRASGRTQRVLSSAHTGTAKDIRLANTASRYARREARQIKSQ